MGVAMLAATQFLEGKRVLYAAPTYDQTDAFWTRVKSFLAPAIESPYCRKNETDRLLELTNGSRLRAKTAYNADTLRGDYADVLILEEYSLMKPDAWQEVGAPMLLDNDGTAVFIFTPKRKNHAFKLFQQAISDTTGRWKAWHFTSFDNPYLNKAALDDLSKDMGADAFKQEIMAEFLDSEGAVFRRLDEACVLKPSTPSEHSGHTILMGIDWAKSKDYTAISVGCKDCHKEVWMDRFNQLDFHFQRERISVLAQAWKPTTILVELNSIGQPNFEELQRAGMPVSGFNTTGATKQPLIENLSLAIEKLEWLFLDDPIARGELESYEVRVNPVTSRSSYSAPDGLHDDTVISRALMLWSAGQSISVMDDPFADW